MMFWFCLEASPLSKGRIRRDNIMFRGDIINHPCSAMGKGTKSSMFGMTAPKREINCTISATTPLLTPSNSRSWRRTESETWRNSFLNWFSFLNINYSSTYLDFRGQVEVVVVFPACVHHAVQHAEDHIAEEAQVLRCGRRWRFKPRLTLMNLLKLLLFLGPEIIIR